MQDFYAENFKILMRKIGDLNKERYLTKGLENNIKMSSLSKFITFKACQSQSHNAFFYRQTSGLNIHMERTGVRIPNTILKNNNEVERLRLPNFKTHYKPTLIKIM